MVEPSIVQRGVDGYTQLFFEEQGSADPMRGTPNDAEAGEDAANFINLSKMSNKKQMCDRNARRKTHSARVSVAHLSQRGIRRRARRQRRQRAEGESVARQESKGAGEPKGKYAGVTRRQRCRRNKTQSGQHVKGAHRMARPLRLMRLAMPAARPAPSHLLCRYTPGKQERNARCGSPG